MRLNSVVCNMIPKLLIGEPELIGSDSEFKLSVYPAKRTKIQRCAANLGGIAFWVLLRQDVLGNQYQISDPLCGNTQAVIAWLNRVAYGSFQTAQSQ
jgi:hypothetical protein